jgi:hypothetical protein
MHLLCVVAVLAGWGVWCRRKDPAEALLAGAGPDAGIGRDQIPAHLEPTHTTAGARTVEAGPHSGGATVFGPQFFNQARRPGAYGNTNLTDVDAILMLVLAAFSCRAPARLMESPVIYC